jgi:hypothetical protein
MKTIAIGDIHGRTYWKQIINQEQDADRFIFVGDYFDSFTVKGLDQINNFLDIIEFKKSTDKEVILLLGNHDYHYYPGIEDSGTSGYQTLMAPSITHAINDSKAHLQVAYQMDEFVFTHAGLSSEWLDDTVVGWTADNMVDKVNELFTYQPSKINYRSYKYYGKDNTKGVLASGYGDEPFQGPIWIRPKSLMNANKKTLRKHVIQVVGHTPQDQIDIKGASTGGRYYFIDTLEYGQNQYLIIKGNIVSLGKINSESSQTK